jgi:hypothetical protein
MEPVMIQSRDPRREFSGGSKDVLTITGYPGIMDRLDALVPAGLGRHRARAVHFPPIRRLFGFDRRCDFSYGMYLYAYPIEQLQVRRLGPGLHPLALFPLATLVTSERRVRRMRNPSG